MWYYVLSLVNKLSRFQELVSESNWHHFRPGEDRINMTNFPFEIIMKHIKNIEKKAGGVLLYIRDSIQYQNMPVVQMKQDFIEKIFIEIEIQCLNTTKNVFIGLIYIVPDSDTFFFNQDTNWQHIFQ